MSATTESRCRSTGNVGARELEERGFMYVGKVLTREQTENALSVVDRAFAAEGQGYSRINSNREQVKLGRRMHQMPPALQEAVAVLEAHWLRADPAAGGEMPPLMDVYALRTAQDERDDVARAPQAWHLDHYSKFPVAAAILKGQGATEFHCGPYADLASGQRPETLEMWTEEWRTGWKVSRQSARHWRVGSLPVTVHLLLRRPVPLFSDVCVHVGANWTFLFRACNWTRIRRLRSRTKSLPTGPPASTQQGS